MMKENTLFVTAILFAGGVASKIALTDTEITNYKYGKARFTGYTKEMLVAEKT